MYSFRKSLPPLIALPALVITSAALCLSALAPPPAAAQAEVMRDSFTVPFNTMVANPCFGGDGELVMASGELEIRTQTVVDAAGGLHMTGILVPHVRGVGLESGIQYNLVGSDRDHFYASAQNGSQNFSDGISFIVIGRGGGANFLVHGILHVTVNAQGVETVSVDTGTTRCVQD